MNILASFLLVFSLSGIISGCGESDTVSDPRAYWSQFVTPQAEMNRNGTYAGSIFYDFALQTDPVRYVDFEIYLGADGNYFVFYAERFEKRASEEFHLTLQGTWNVDASGRLVLSDIGSATPAKYRAQTAMLFTFSKDVHSPGLAGRSIHLVLVAPR
jgi:hypothetical protein